MGNNDLKQYIRSIMESKQPGLHVLQLPTGYGKTYNVCQAIAQFMLSEHVDRKVVFLTTLLKNLPEAELLAAMDGNKELYQKTVLRIPSNFDQIVEYIETVGVPEKFRTEQYSKLIGLVKKYQKVNGNKVADTDYLEHLRQSISLLERQFRRTIQHELKNQFATEKDRLNAIRTQKEWKWVGALYPSVFTDEYSVLLMSVNKFLLKNSTLIRPSYSFLKADWLKDAIVIIDEFDATKDTIKKALIDEAISSSQEYLSLFRQIYHGLREDYLSQPMKEALLPIGEWFESIKNEATEIVNEHNIFLSFKLVDTERDWKQHFLFHDLSYHTIAENGRKYLRGELNQGKNRVDVYIEPREKYYANLDKSSGGNVSLYSVLRSIERFFRHFRLFLYQWADNYKAKIENDRGLEADEFSIENSIASILSKLELPVESQMLIMREMPNHVKAKRTDDLLRDNSFYQDGMEIFGLEDNDMHADSTEMKFISVHDTPEKVLQSLSSRATVIGISATAEVPSVIGNYDLTYLRDTLREDYHTIPDNLKETIRQELQQTWRAYADGRITLHPKVVPYMGAKADVQSMTRNVLQDEELTEIAANLIEAETSDSFFQGRYVNIMQVMREFWKQSIHSLLYLGMALASSNNRDFNIELLRRLFYLSYCDVQAEKGEPELDQNTIEKSLVVLRSHNFDEDKQQLIQQLESGEPVFILSTYQTIGAGQNLQYRALDKSGLIELVPDLNDGDKRHVMKDIDALYLGDITHMTINTYSGERISQQELVHMLFQIEELKQNHELSFAEADEMIKLAFQAFMTGNSQFRTNLLYRQKSVMMQANKHVMQAVGRICRTYLKSSDIYLFVDEKLLEKIHIGELKRHILTPEMESLVSLREGLGKDYTDEEEETLLKAEKISIYGLFNIRQMLDHKWTAGSMKLWNALRECVLRHPVASKELWCEDELIHKLYITAGVPASRYMFSKYSDFARVNIDFGDDMVAFRNSSRVSRTAEENEIVIQEMSDTQGGLMTAMRYPGMREYFEKECYATSFEENDYMMSPVVFNNIYKGVLGEVAGSFILKRERGITLNPITDPDRFEFFDFEMKPDVYVDFKNWKFSTMRDRKDCLRQVDEKLKTIGGKRVYIINLIGSPEHFEATVSNDGRIVEIPGLIDSEGNVISKSFKAIREEDIE